MVKDLIIIGAGGTGREVAEVIDEINSLERKWNLLGFLDDDPKKHRREYNGYPVLGPVSTATNYATCRFVLVLGNHRDLSLTKRVLDRLGLPGNRFATVIHPTVCVSRYTELGPGTIVMQNCVISPNTRIGSHVLVLPGSHIAHDCDVADHVVIAPNAVLLGGVCIREDCYIGANATILQKIKVGPRACVAMGAAVFSVVGPDVTVVGNPARLLCQRVDPRV
jgi:sugar O-acyltransferase (sialic acid O-acetyltransferase NeuD family)